MNRGLRRLCSSLSRPHSGTFAPGTVAPWGSEIAAPLPEITNRELDTEKRKEFHKSLSRAIKKRKFGQFDKLMENMNASGVELDEVTFSLAFFSALLAPSGGVAAAEAVVAEMRRSAVVHPSLGNFYGNFLQSLKELEIFDAYPNELNIRKCLKPCWEISRQFKQLRLAISDPLPTTGNQAVDSRRAEDAGARLTEKFKTRKSQLQNFRSRESRMQKMARSVGWPGKIKSRQ